MAGKFGSSAGAVIADALVRARAEGTSRIGEEHLFAALLANPDSTAPRTCCVTCRSGCAAVRP